MIHVKFFLLPRKGTTGCAWSRSNTRTIHFHVRRCSFPGEVPEHRSRSFFQYHLPSFACSNTPAFQERGLSGGEDNSPSVFSSSSRPDPTTISSGKSSGGYNGSRRLFSLSRRARRDSRVYGNAIFRSGNSTKQSDLLAKLMRKYFLQKSVSPKTSLDNKFISTNSIGKIIKHKIDQQHELDFRRFAGNTSFPV